MLEVMVVKPERPDWDGSEGWFIYFLPSFFHELKCRTNFSPLMETLIIPDNTDVCLHIEARKKVKTIIMTGRKNRHTLRVRKDRENSTEGQLINCPLWGLLKTAGPSLVTLPSIISLNGRLLQAQWLCPHFYIVMPIKPRDETEKEARIKL